MVDQKVVDAFQMMWGPFPEPVLLVQKNRTILAINDAARKVGVPLGIKCSSLNPETKTDDNCKDCKALQSLRSATAITESSLTGKRHLKAYWVPLQNFEDVYVHFAINITEEINAAVGMAKAA